MRVNQIQNLTWAATVVVLAGVVWVGLQFWEARKTKAAKEPEWKRAAAPPIQNVWPPELASIAYVWKTPINGVVPPPPTVVDTTKPKVDANTELKAKVTYLGGLEVIGDPSRSTARVSVEGKETTISPGESVTISVDGRQTSFLLVQCAVDSQKHTARLVFKAPEGTRSLDDKPIDLIVLEQPDKQTQPVTAPGAPLFETAYSDLVARGIVTKDGPLAKVTFQDPVSKDWIVSEHEQAWFDHWGEKELFDKLPTKQDLDADGVSHGLRILRQPEEGTRLGPSHGLIKDDIIRSINGVAVGSKEDILRYLRGPGKGLDRYEVVVERGDLPDVGKQRTVVYRVHRSR